MFTFGGIRRYLQYRPSLKYRFIDDNRGRFFVAAMCRVLDLAPSGYYAWRSREESLQSQSDRRLLVEIRMAYTRSKRRYGSPRIYKALRERDLPCSKNRIARLMRLNGIQAKHPRRFKITTDSDHALPLAENLLDRQFEVEVPNARWAADIWAMFHRRYIWTSEGWLYLAVVMDLYSRRIIGWSMQHTLERTLVLQALRMALQARQPTGELLHHSDRGSQYASREYRELLEAAGCTCSMSRKGNCWDNAPVESFFSTLKRELVHGRRFESRSVARQEIFEFIEIWYNRERLHSSLGYLTPAAFEEQMIVNTPSIAA